MMSVFLGIKRRKYNKKDVWCHTPFLRFHRFNISLASCSAAELVSVSVEHCKFQSFKLYLQTVKKASHLQDDIAFEKAKSYLFQAAYNTMIDTIRKDKRIELQEDVQMTSSVHQPDLGLKEALELALNNLPSIQKSAVLLRDYEGYDYKEIGEILNLNESQVKVYIFRARKNLRAFFTGKEELVA
jgi:RNA polymerase sigma-70 factor (ECF subfamily)